MSLREIDGPWHFMYEHHSFPAAYARKSLSRLDRLRDGLAVELRRILPATLHELVPL